VAQLQRFGDDGEGWAKTAPSRSRRLARSAWPALSNGRRRRVRGVRTIPRRSCPGQ
jgi:hypothetical protein